MLDMPGVSRGGRGRVPDDLRDRTAAYCVVGTGPASRRAWWFGESDKTTANLPAIPARRPAWDKGRIVGRELPLLPKHVRAIRVRL